MHSQPTHIPPLLSPPYSHCVVYDRSSFSYWGHRLPVFPFCLSTTTLLLNAIVTTFPRRHRYDIPRLLWTGSRAEWNSENASCA